jgi:TP901 family phage tail tape measure protein
VISLSTLTKELKVKITADANGLKGALNGISKDISKIGKDFDGLKNLGQGISSVGKALTAGLTLPIVGMGVASVKTASDFQGAMKEVSAISGATGTDLTKLSDLAKEMGRTTKFSASESADALKYMGMAGWKTQDMIEGLPGILNLAAAGGTDLATTSDIVTDGLTAMGLSAKDSGKFADIMAAACSNANTNIDLMGETLKYVGPVAGALGISMDDLSVAIGLMGNAGLKGGQAGTSLRAGLTNLVKPTKEMRNAMEKYGVELVKNADGSVNLMGTMENLRSVLGGLDQTTQAQALSTIFGKEAMSGWASIVNASEGDFNKLTEAIANSEGSAKKMADTMLEGSQGAIVEMKSALEGVAITIGERLTPFLEKLADGVSKVCEWFQNLSPATQTFLMIVATLIASIGPLLLLIGGAISLFANLSIVAGALGISIGALCAPVLAVVAVIGAIIAIGFLLVSNWDLIKEKANEVWKIVCDAWKNMCDWISKACNNIGNWISKTWDNICDWTSKTWNNVKAAISTVWNSIKSFISDKLNQIKTSITNVWNNIKSVTSTVWNSIKSFVSSLWNSITSVASSVFNSIKTVISTIWNTIKSTTTSVWNSIKSVISSVSNAIKSVVLSAWNGIQSVTSSVLNGVKSVVSNVFNGIKSSISSVMSSIRSSVSSAWSAIKGIFSSVLKPNIKMPKISISGKFSLNPPSVPKFGISWYSKGAIFKRPTVLGGIGIGDAHNGIGSNAEAILPINQLPKLLGLDKMQNNNGINLNIENFNNNTDKDIEYLANELAFYMNRKRIGVGGAY